MSTTHAPLKIDGERYCQCARCEECFSSTSAFDKHIPHCGRRLVDFNFRLVDRKGALVWAYGRTMPKYDAWGRPRIDRKDAGGTTIAGEPVDARSIE